MEPGALDPTLYLPSSALLSPKHGPTSRDSTKPTNPCVTMPPEPVRDDDYVSEEDSDFALDDAPAEDSSGSDDEAADTETPAAGKGKQQGEDGADDAGFENSGDEAIIEKGKSRQRKSKRKDLEADGDEGGEGGLIKTRRMRAAE